MVICGPVIGMTNKFACTAMTTTPAFIPEMGIVGSVLPGFQKGRDTKASQGKGQGAVLAKKGQFVSYKEKLEKQTEFHLGQ
jgi:hypothetical protein